MVGKSKGVKFYDKGLNFVYVNSHLVVCAAPKSNLEAENLGAHFLTQHPGNHLIIDCTEGGCPLLTRKIFGSVEKYTGVLVLMQIMHLVHRAETYLSVNNKGVIVLICESGCDKSCVFAGSFLLHQGAVMTTEDAIQAVNDARSTGINVALRMPSMCRYLLYYEMLLRGSQETRHCNTYQLSRIRIINGVPNLHRSLLLAGCFAHFKVSVVCQDEGDTDDTGEIQLPEDTDCVEKKKVFDQLEEMYNNDMARVPFTDQRKVTKIDVDLSSFKVLLRGDCIVEMFSEELCAMRCAFHTAFITNDYMLLDKDVIDFAADDSEGHSFPGSMKMELFFTGVDDKPSVSAL